MSGNYKKIRRVTKRIFDRVHSDSEYKIWLHFYVTNDLHNSDVETFDRTVFHFQMKE